MKKNFTTKERKYLKLCGIDHDGFTQKEKIEFIKSLRKDEMKKFDEYDASANCCPFCVKTGKVNVIITRNMRRCPNCGNTNNIKLIKKDIEEQDYKRYMEKITNLNLIRKNIEKQNSHKID